MLEQFFDFIRGYKNHVPLSFNNREYLLRHKDFNLKEMTPEPFVPSLGVTTLTGLVEYVQNDVDDYCKDILIHVKSSTQVAVYQKVTDDDVRELVLLADCTQIAGYKTFPSDRYMPHEDFILKLRSLFVWNDALKAFVDQIKSVKISNSTDLKDDGVQQSVTTRNDLAQLETSQMPTFLTLQPWRTFHEIEQPTVDYVFRIQASGSGCECMLLEADGNQWQQATMEEIKSYLQDQLSDRVIIS